jgi:hypothetical protein
VVVTLVFSVCQILCPFNLTFVLRAFTETLNNFWLRVSANHSSRIEPTLGTVIGTGISWQSFAFILQQFVNSQNEFSQSRHGCLLI